MLANFPRRYFYVLCGAVSLSLFATLSQAQQTPSSRYQPVGYRFTDDSTQNSSVPPSVHIPPSRAHSLPLGVNPQVGNRTASAGLPQHPQHSGQQNFGSRGMIRQTSFNEDPNKTSQEPSVPEILQRKNQVEPNSTSNSHPNPTSAPLATQLGNLPQPPANANEKRSAHSNSGETLPSVLPSQSPADFSNQLKQLRQAPSVEPKEMDRVAQMEKDLEGLRQRAAQREQTPSGNDPSVSKAENTDHQNGFSTSIPAPLAKPEPKNQTTALDSSFAERSSVGTVPISLRPEIQPLNSMTTAQPNPDSLGGQSESMRDFMGTPNANPAMSQPAATMGQVTDSRVKPAAMQVPSDGNAIASQQTSNGFDEHSQKNSAIRLSAPAISVESFGPQSIGINKPAVYKVVATNETNKAAERVVVTIDVPAWVEIDQVNMTAGERQVADGKQQSRVIWKVDQIPGNGSQTLTITAIPRKAEPFEFGIEWTIAPRVGVASIQVTQPKLEMSIVGPEEVHFGETASYEVTVRNSGNGDAENVIVILSESLGGERGPLGDVSAGSSKSFTVNLYARTPGELDLGVTAVSDSKTEATTARKLVIRRANLGITINGPSLRYAGTAGQYLVKVSNTGDATAEEVVAALGLPSGVKFLGGIETFKLIEGGLRWQVGRLEPGQTREYKIDCQLDAAGDLQLEVGTQGRGALQAAHACVTRVQTIADLVMQVNDPPGPLTTGDEITYEIVIQNRGTKAAKGVDIFMILSEGMEPKSGSGLEFRIPRDGALQFATVPQIDPGQKLMLKVNAVAYKPGTHVFRAHLVCEEADAREIKEGTSKFFGDDVNNPLGNGNTASESSNFNNSDSQNKLK